VCGDGKIAKTTNGGETWTTKFDGGMYYGSTVLYFVDKNIGFCTYKDGTILKTINGGTTWNQLITCTRNGFSAVYFTDANSGFLVGPAGMILKTTVGGGIITGINPPVDISHSPATMLLQNYPNPFNETTTISWQLPEQAHIILKIYDFTGREMKTLLDCDQAKGEYAINFNASELTSGVYFYQLQANGITETKKMVVNK
jgi:photosystem II stability/assembly factor-like uncharacterized protein